MAHVIVWLLKLVVHLQCRLKVTEKLFSLLSDHPPKSSWQYTSFSASKFYWQPVLRDKSGNLIGNEFCFELALWQDQIKKQYLTVFNVLKISINTYEK